MDSPDNACSSSQASAQGSVVSGQFSEITEDDVIKFDGSKCWACLTTNVQIAHMIGRKDPQVNRITNYYSAQIILIYYAQVGLWSGLGLINFSLTSHQNGIPLCPTCHTEFDLTLDPGLIIVPTHLEYFIDFELADRERREGKQEARSVPTAGQYRLYQEQKDREQTGEENKIIRCATGGMYTPVFLKHYFHEGLASNVHAMLSYDRPWHGSPLAAFRRAFMALGSGRIGMIQPQMKVNLQRLRDLYFYKDIASMTIQPAENPTQLPQSPGVQKRSGSPLDDVNQQRPTKMPRHDFLGEDQGGAGCSEGRDDSAVWTFGPSMNTEDIVRRFAPVMGGFTRRQVARLPG
ncbi:hypothetical protein PHISP_00359 [Aspergillus sp. HF37]|nr:hypothetical protein PHISP_00359 [Aspergillus sp. HF37]